MGVLISALYFPVSSVIRLSEKVEGKTEFLNIKIQQEEVCFIAVVWPLFPPLRRQNTTCEAHPVSQWLRQVRLVLTVTVCIISDQDG